MKPVSQISAEQAYLFRHSVLRDAAYQLQMPGARARLHALALLILEDVIAALPRATQDALAFELCSHAQQAQLGLEREDRGLREAELSYRQRAAEHASRMFQHALAARLFDQLAASADLAPDNRCEALRRAGIELMQSGATSEGEARLRRAVEMAQGIAHAKLHARTLSSLAEGLRLGGRMAEAESNFVEAIARARKQGERDIELMSRANYAIILRETGRVARRGASLPRKKDAQQQLPTRSTLSRPNLAAR